MNARTKVAGWHRFHGCTLFVPIPEPLLTQVLTSLNVHDSELTDLYRATNGLVLEWFRVLPIEDDQNLKKTWDGLRRANDPSTSPYLNANADLLKRFLVFATLGGGKVAVLDRQDNSIWYEENEELYQTDLDFEGFLETMFREVAEL
jgi:hypothetical protein